MVDRGELARRALLALASIGLLVAGGVLAVRSGATSAGPTAGHGALPSELRGRPSTPSTSSSSSPPSSASAEQPDTSAQTAPLVPVSIDIPVASTHYPHGVHATVTSHPLNADGSVYVPPDPQVVSWASNEAAVGSDRGTAIIAGHVNYVINGRLVIGALADLAQYARQSVGAIITVHTRDGGELNYRITAGREYNKNLLAANSRLRASLFDQTSVFGVASHPTGRLLLVSCGGNFDPATGEYDDNVFLYALPVG